MFKMGAFWTAFISLIAGILFWRNVKKYPKRNKRWNAIKTLSETTILFLTIFFAPALLIGWCIGWIVRPIKGTWIKIVVGIVSGVVLAAISSIAAEILILIGIFSIDLKTGSSTTGGWLNCYNRAKKDIAA